LERKKKKDFTRQNDHPPLATERESGKREQRLGEEKGGNWIGKEEYQKIKRRLSTIGEGENKESAIGGVRVTKKISSNRKPDDATERPN